MKAIIRPIQPSEYPLLEEFHYMSIFVPPGQDPYPREIIYQPKSYQYIENFGRFNDICVVAEVDGKVVGAAWSRFIHGYGYVDDVTPELVVSVMPEYRGQNIGTALLENLHDVVQNMNNWQISLAVDKRNPAVRLYKRLGYETVDENEDDYIMLKSFVPERMDEFFDTRIDIYEQHMLDMKLDKVYQKVAALIQPSHAEFSLLDLGCGTGLELEPLFEMYPKMHVTGIDMSSSMLDQLKAKFPDKRMNLIQASFFDEDVWERFNEVFDFALSTYALHHFTETEKLNLYKMVLGALKPGGTFVIGDYTVPTQEWQDRLQKDSISLREKHRICEGDAYHIDIPLTVDTEIKLLKDAGFKAARTVSQWENGSIIVAAKGRL